MRRELIGYGRRLLPRRHVWRSGLEDELAFWADYIATRGGRWPEEFEYRLDALAPIDEPLISDRLAGMPGKQISILDVGAGPLTRLGKTHPGKQISITATDALAEEYAALLRDAGVVAPVPTVRCAGEQLLETFGEKRFDVVYARNALDHAADPMRIIKNMVALLEPHGLVAMRHYHNEGRTVAYGGLHQWNFDIRHGNLVLWSRRDEHDITRRLANTANVECWEDHDWIVAVLTTPRAVGLAPSRVSTTAL